MLSRAKMIRLALICIFSWTFILGVFFESMENEDRPADQALLFGRIERIHFDENLSSGTLEINDGRAVIELAFNDGLPNCKAGQPIAVLCSIDANGALELIEVFHP